MKNTTSSNAYEQEKDDHNFDVFYTDDGWLTEYSLGCGYLEKVDRDKEWLSLWKEGCFHVRLHDFEKQERVFWEAFDDLDSARAFFLQAFTKTFGGCND